MDPPEDDNQLKIYIHNTSKHQGGDTGRWLWRVYLELNKTAYSIRQETTIVRATMHLHETFPEPIVDLQRQRKDKNSFQSDEYTGWGTFKVLFDIQLVERDKISGLIRTCTVRLSHELEFTRWPFGTFVSLETKELALMPYFPSRNRDPYVSVVVEEYLSKPTPGDAIPAYMCGISYQQLLDLDSTVKSTFGEEEYPTKTMRDVCKVIIEPICNKTNKSYALSINKDGLLVNAFTSHSWDGYFVDFVQAIKEVYQCTKPNLWVCAFALLQGGEDKKHLVSQQLGTSSNLPLENTPFVVALEAATALCVVRNSRVDVYSRIWCVCELMYAKTFNLYPDHTVITGPNAFAECEQTTVLDAKASRLEDRDRILKVLLNEHDRAEIDRIVHRLRTLTDREDDRLLLRESMGRDP
ncbi:expressed unknown protein [Seminavis robusta]|uniref:YEATS domain-containing protein n=1 Tax=Seminavis robusta TaxID=568900 RepID=A0A9N8EZJ3_9STRA|nr:expressed unknown protein [Seminavis robusta]|eukprot:Sro2102_g314622.1  (410) ;mRNA; r:11233-12462